jgi:hypothetical protein
MTKPGKRLFTSFRVTPRGKEIVRFVQNNCIEEDLFFNIEE